MTLNSLQCADVPLRNCSMNQSSGRSVVVVAGDTVRSRVEWHAERSALFVCAGKDRQDRIRAELRSAGLPTVARLRPTTAAYLR